MEAARFSVTSVLTGPTQCYVLEDGILESHRRENLKSYSVKIDFKRSRIWEKVLYLEQIANHHSRSLIKQKGQFYFSHTPMW
jgi:hypothetical protein